MRERTDETVPLEEAARMLGLAPKTLRNWAASGRVRALRRRYPKPAGGRRVLLFRIADLERLMGTEPARKGGRR